MASFRLHVGQQLHSGSGCFPATASLRPLGPGSHGSGRGSHKLGRGQVRGPPELWRPGLATETVHSDWGRGLRGNKRPRQEKGVATGAVGRERGRGLTALLCGRDHASGPRGRDGVTCVHSPRGVRAVSSAVSCEPSCPPVAGARAAAQRAVSGARGGEPREFRPGWEGTALGCAGLHWAGARGRERGPEPLARGRSAARDGLSWDSTVTSASPRA